jgi:nitroreductase
MDEVFKKRHSVRSFQNREIEREKLKEILEAVESAPSAGDLKARKIIVVEDFDLKQKLVKAARDQIFVGEVPVVLVFFALPSVSEKIYKERGKNLYAVQDATIAVCFAWLQAVMLGIDACWVGAFDEAAVKEVLNSKEDERPIAILPLGYKK